MFMFNRPKLMSIATYCHRNKGLLNAIEHLDQALRVGLCQMTARNDKERPVMGRAVAGIHTVHKDYPDDLVWV